MNKLKKIIFALIALASVTNVALAEKSLVCTNRAQDECTSKPELVTTTLKACLDKQYLWCIAEKFQPNPVK